jgi:hypothetical protein
MGRGHKDTSDDKAAGIRAPIQLRTNSNPCSTNVDVFTDSYVSIEDDYTGDADFAQIRQIGWDNDYLPGGPETHCKFWAIGIGAPHDYACSHADQTITYFRVDVVSLIGSNQVWVYDCGQTNWTSGCTVEGMDSVPNKYEVDALTETADSCDYTIAGSASNSVNIGTSSHPIETKNDIGDSFSTHDMEINRADPYGCGHWHKNWQGSPTFTIQTWDDRNSS